MKLYEQMKLFTGADSDELETRYNNWMREQMKERSEIHILSNKPFLVLHRDFVIRNYEGEETYALAIYYEYAELSNAERGGDKAPSDMVGASAFSQQKQPRVRSRR